MLALLSSLRQLVEFSRTECRACAAFSMQDRDTQRVYRLYDFTKAQLIIPPDQASGIAGKVNSPDELHLVIESVLPDARQTRCSNVPVPVPADGAGGSGIG